MNTFLVMLVSLIVGAVAGGTAALVVVEIKTEELSTKIHNVKDSVGNVTEMVQIQNEVAQDTNRNTMLINEALQRFINKYNQDKTWMVQSLNDLWVDYDARHKKAMDEEVLTANDLTQQEEQIVVPKKTRKPRKRTQAKEMKDDLEPKEEKPNDSEHDSL